MLNMALGGGKWSLSFHGRLTPKKGTLLIGGWAGSRASLNVLEKRKISSPVEIRTPDRPICSVEILTLRY